MKKLLFIYNAYAGKGQVKTRLPAMLDLFTKVGWQGHRPPYPGGGGCRRGGRPAGRRV